MDERLIFHPQMAEDATVVSLYAIKRFGSKVVHDLLLIGVPIKEDRTPDLSLTDLDPSVNEYLLTDVLPQFELEDLDTHEVPPEPIVLFDGRLSVSEGEREAVVDNEIMKLTKMEFNLLSYLARFPDIFHTPMELLEAVWGYSFAVDTTTVRVHVTQVRKKLKHLGAALENKVGQGYRLNTCPVLEEAK